MLKAFALLALLPSTLAHFLLNYPATLGFDDDKEGTAPCGGFDINFNGNVTNVTVGGFAVAVRSTHPQATWLFKYTTDSAEPYNWQDFNPNIAQSGLGDFCLPQLSVPSNLTGQRGVLQITQQAVDGSLYQCAAVNFVEGETAQAPSACINGSSVSAYVTGSSSSSASTPAATGSQSSSTSAAAAATNIVGGMLAMVPVGLLML